MEREFTEADLIQLFDRHHALKKKRFFNPLTTLLSIIGLSLFLILFINYQAITKQFSFWFSTSVQNTSFENPKIEKVVTQKAVPKSLLPDVPNNSIYIDKLNLRVPVTFDVPDDAASVETGLQNGVIQLKNTAHPGEVGNVFITGHSSNYFWDKGSYNQIFSLLNNLELGNNVVVNYQGNLYVYQVTDKNVVIPTDVSVMEQGRDSLLTLMTCYPVGTNLKRLIVVAKQVSPNPTLNKPSSLSSPTKLPGISR